MPITRLSHQGKSWPVNEFVAACLRGDCNFPSPVAASIIKNMTDYNNRGTISGSQLYAECDYSRLLDQLPHTVEISNQFYASFRGANVHAMIEECKNNPAFKDWIFEKRFFATLDPETGAIKKLEVPEKNGEPDWEFFDGVCADLRASGLIILSGALDAYDGKHKRISDWKTAKTVGTWTNVKKSWQQQMNEYTILAEVNGYPVNEIEITVFDATQPVTLQVPKVNRDVWVPEYLIPRAVYLTRLQQFTADEIQAINSGEVDPPEGFPVPVVNYLCEGKGKEAKIYCPHRENALCPKWRNILQTSQTHGQIVRTV